MAWWEEELVSSLLRRGALVPAAVAALREQGEPGRRKRGTSAGPASEVDGEPGGRKRGTSAGPASEVDGEPGGRKRGTSAGPASEVDGEPGRRERGTSAGPASEVEAPGASLGSRALALVGADAGLAALGEVLASSHTRAAAPVLGEVGQGGMGRVLRVRDVDAGRDVARKELRSKDAGAEARARFLREARVTAQLEHPGIVPVYSVSTRGEPSFTMRLVRGRTLDRVAADGATIPALLRLFLRVCEAVAFAHDRGVIHRDLKPQNVMVGEHGEVLVLDWGLARRLAEPDAPPATGEPATSEPASADPAPSPRRPPEGASARPHVDRETRSTPRRPGAAERELGFDHRTGAGQLLGTPAYMPPEQAGAQGGVVDERSDVYALGAILYELLALVPPFRGASVLELLQQVVSEPPAPPRRAAPARGIPRALEAIALRALEKAPDARYPSARALADDVTRFLEGAPVSARPVGPVGRALLWAKRHVALAASLAVTTTLGLALGVAATTSVGRSADEAARIAGAAAAADARRAADLDASAAADAGRARLAEERAAAGRRRAQALAPYLEVSDLLRRDISDEVLRARVIPPLERAVAIDPGFVPAHLALARARLALGEVEVAQADIGRAIEAERVARGGEASPRVVLELAMLEARFSYRRDAWAALAERVERIASSDPRIRLVRALLSSDRVARAAELDALVDEVPYRGEVVVAWVRFRAADRFDTRRARAELDRLDHAILGLSPDPITRRGVVKLLLHRARSLSAAGRAGDAVRDALAVERALQGHIQLGPAELHEAYVMTGILHLRDGRDAAGLARLARADELLPGAGETGLVRGELWIVRGDPLQALPELAEAMARAREHGPPRAAVLEQAAALHVIAAVEAGRCADAVASSELALPAVAALRRPGVFAPCFDLPVEARLCRALGALARWHVAQGDAARAAEVTGALRRAAELAESTGLASAQARRHADTNACAEYGLAAHEALGLPLAPASRARLHSLRATGRAGLSRWAEAAEDLRAALASLGPEPADRRFAAMSHHDLAVALARVAIQRVGSLERATPAERDAVLDELEAAVAISPRDLGRLHEDPDLQALRGDPRFQAIVERAAAGR